MPNHRPAAGPVAVFAPAKVNLALHVIGRRADGYHEIDTLVAFASIGDRIEAKLAAELHLEIDGPFADVLRAGEGVNANLVLEAARRLRTHAAQNGGNRVRGAHLRLVKNLPVAGGIGGGSADAAAALIALRQLWEMPAEFDLAPIAGGIGADVPMCLISGPLRATGIGERIVRLPRYEGDEPAQLPGLLVNPGISVATHEVFARLTPRARAGLSEIGDDPLSPSFLAGLRNDLEAAAIAMAPPIRDVLGVLRENPGCRLARMSGSGPTCFGLFDSIAGAAAAGSTLQRERPEWWIRPVLLGGGRARLEEISDWMDRHEPDR